MDRKRGRTKKANQLLAVAFSAFIWPAILFAAPDDPAMPGSNPPTTNARERVETGLLLKKEGVGDGYVLIATRGRTSTYLIDSDGFVVHEWRHDRMASLSAYLLPNGHLLHAVRYSDEQVGDIVQELDWDGAVVWEYFPDSPVQRIHHDMERLPNGNTLITVWERKSLDEYMAAGRNPDTVANNEMWVDSIQEIKPVGRTGGEVVWRWSAWDHLVQEYDENLPNYGVPSAHPDRLDLNQARTTELEEFQRLSDWLHINSVAYHAGRDELLVTSHSMSEIWVISKKTGKIIYRWGNPSRYGRGIGGAQVLLNPHDAHWIPEGLRGAGNLLVYNNEAGTLKGDEKYSEVLELKPPLTSSGDWPAPTEGGAFPDCEVVWRYGSEAGTRFYAVSVSNAQRLKNGGTLVTVGVDGMVFELSASGGDVVWKYVNPVFYNGPQLKNLEKWNAAPPPGENLMFRAYKYPPDYAAFAGKDLSPKQAMIELSDNHGMAVPAP